MNADVSKYENRELITKYVTKIDSMIKETEEKFTILRQEAETDSRPIDSSDLVNEQNYSISIMQKWITKFAEERTTLKNINRKRTEMEAEILDYYRFHWDKSTKLSETAISKYTAGHACFLSVSAYMKTIENIVEFIEKVIDLHKSRQYAIRNLIELKKMELGL